MRLLVNMWDTLLGKGQSKGGVISMIISIQADGWSRDANSIAHWSWKAWKLHKKELGAWEYLVACKKKEMKRVTVVRFQTKYI